MGLAKSLKDAPLGYLLLLAIAVAVLGQFGHQLWTPDEPREAAIAWEMFKSGDLIVPTLGGASFIEKPPLYYIVAVPFLGLLHDTLGITVTMRLVGVLWALGTLLFTGLLAKRVLGSNQAALWSVIALGTMEGFIMNSHWIRVDVALAFFVVFTMWAMAELYLAGRSQMVWLAGLGLAASFMTKGPIGPLTIFFGWLPLFVLALKERIAQGNVRMFILQHLLMAVLFLLPNLLWIAALLNHAQGAELWHEWFWQNQVGRLNGTSTNLGHIKPDAHFFYLVGIAEYTLPWLPLVAVWFWRTLKDRKWDRGHLFVLVWALGTVLLLSISSTKRTLYLFPLMPVFALMMGQLSEQWPRWVKGYGRGWALFMCLFSLLLLASPLYHGLLPAKVPEPVRLFLATPDWQHLVGALFLLVMAAMCWRWRAIEGAVLVACSSAAMFLMAFILVFPMVDVAKGMQQKMDDFLAKVPLAERAQIAGRELGETELGLFTVYGDWPVMNVDKARLDLIMTCQDPLYTSVIVNKDEPAPVAKLVGDRPYELLGQGHPRGDKDGKGIYWVKGICTP